MHAIHLILDLSSQMHNMCWKGVTMYQPPPCTPVGRSMDTLYVEPKEERGGEGGGHLVHHII